MMPVILSKTDDFVREVAINPITRLDQTYQLAFSSRLLTAKNPLEVKRNFDLILSGDELLILKNLIDQTLAMN
jgi:hypothetical protein